MAVAYSGGRDSTALLHATLLAAREQGIEVLALHVHHGLSNHADEWLAHGEAQCARWAARGLPVHFIAARLSGKPARGESSEAWAREQRYRALRTMAESEGTSLILLAHHRRDQAETFLLQALRGAGVSGLAGMPMRVERDGMTWARPWLDVPRERIEAYVRRHRLAHVDDDSNADTTLARNRLRHAVWPALSDAFPHAEATLADAAAWAQEAAACTKELAAIDLAAVASVRGLDVQAWLALSPARRSNALRAWLRAQIGRPASGNLVSRLMSELPGRGSASWVIEGAQLRRYRGVLRCIPSGDAPRAESASTASAARPAREERLSVQSTGLHRLPGWGGQLEVVRTTQGGVPLAWLAHAELRARERGERFQAGVGRPPRSLKKQYQAAAVPAWEREGPLVYSGGQLVFVPGLGIDARVMALPGQTQVALHWRPLAAERDDGAG